MADKLNIQTLTNTDWIYRLSPKQFQYSKNNADNTPSGVPDEVLNIGLLPEDVANIRPDLLVKDLQGNAIGVDYQKLIVPILIELLDLKGQLEGLVSRVDILESN